MNKITVCLTSCNRFHLLERTLNSFLALNTYPIEKYIINEDSGSKEVIKKIIDKYGDLVHVIRSPKNEGLLKAIDNLYKLVDTEYIFHMEDDWLFSGNNNFMQQSLDILNGNPGIHQVWIRNGIPQDWLDSENHGIYKMVKQQHCGDWCGFSLNCSLKRLNDYKKMFPSGYNALRILEKNSAISEHECNMHAYKQGYRAALLNNPACTHIGDGQSTY